MEQLARRQLLQLFFAAGAAAAVGVSATKALAATPVETEAADIADATLADAETGLVSEMEPTQAVVIRPGRRGNWRRRSPRIIVRPRRRRRVCWRRRPRGPLVCTWR
jgi:hypothetical protein